MEINAVILTFSLLILTINGQEVPDEPPVAVIGGIGGVILFVVVLIIVCVKCGVCKKKKKVREMPRQFTAFDIGDIPEEDKLKLRRSSTDAPHTLIDVSYVKSFDNKNEEPERLQGVQAIV